MLNAKGGVTSLVTDLRAKVGSLCCLIQIKKGIALAVGFVNQFPWDTVVDQGKKSDVFEGVTDLLNKAFTVVVSV